MTVVVVTDGVTLIVSGESGEYFCHGCGHLRLWVRDKPNVCKNCSSRDIVFGEVNSPELTQLRKEFQRPARS